MPTHVQVYTVDVGLDAANSPLLFQPSYSVFGASISFSSPDTRLRVTGGVTNLTDKRYLRGGFSDPATIGTTIGSYSRPREWFVKISHEF